MNFAPLSKFSGAPVAQVILRHHSQVPTEKEWRRRRAPLSFFSGAPVAQVAQFTQAGNRTMSKLQIELFREAA
jgi:hypothetical protein